MNAPADDQEPREEPGSGEDEENPFEQEEVFPAIPKQDQTDDEPPLMQEQDDPAYMPEDAVIEYGYEKSEDFYDPSKSEEGADGVFVTEPPPAPAEEKQPPPPAEDNLKINIPSAQAAEAERPGGMWDNQLDEMFPDDGFKKEGSLDWDQKKEPEGVALTEPYPSMPPDIKPATIPPVPPVLEEPGAESQPAHILITPSGRKKEVSPEIAELLDRTSKRQPPISARAGKKAAKKEKSAASTVILVLLLVAFGAGSGYLFMDARKKGAQIARTVEQARTSQAALKEAFTTRLNGAEAEKRELEGKLEEAAQRFEAYKDEVRGDVAKVESLRNSIQDLNDKILQLKQVNARIPELEKQLEQEKAHTDVVAANLRNANSDRETLKNGIIARETTIKELKSLIAGKDSRITALKTQLDELLGTPGHISASEFARLRGVEKKSKIEIEALEKQVKSLGSALDKILQGATGQDEINKLIAKLVRKNDQINELEEQIDELELALQQYSSPESTIVRWAKALASGKLASIINNYYAENNIHRKRFEAGGPALEELTREYKEFISSRIEPEVLSITINPGQNSATAKLKLKLTADGKTRVIKANMLLVHEFDHWAILDEGF